MELEDNNSPHSIVVKASVSIPLGPNIPHNHTITLPVVKRRIFGGSRSRPSQSNKLGSASTVPTAVDPVQGEQPARRESGYRARVIGTNS